MRRILAIIAVATGCGDLLGFSGDDEPPRDAPMENDTDAGGSAEASTTTGEGGVLVGEAGGVIDDASSNATWICAIAFGDAGLSSPAFETASECMQDQNFNGCGVTPGGPCTPGEVERRRCDPCPSVGSTYRYSYDVCSCQDLQK